MGNRDSDFGAFLAGFVIGGLVGAATALLLAPQSGEETRMVIRDKSIELKDKATETAEEARKRAEHAAADAKAKAEELSQQAKVKADELKHRGQVVLEEQKHKLDEGRAKIEEAIATRKKGATEDEAPPAEEALG
ncbi:MAG: YtxH domain-containing protein [Anaerolineales bacterium]|nr:YtxH domain-containing protein [Anaerolineales bacterium]